LQSTLQVNWPSFAPKDGVDLVQPSPPFGDEGGGYGRNKYWPLDPNHAQHDTLEFQTSFAFKNRGQDEGVQALVDLLPRCFAPAEFPGRPGGKFAVSWVPTGRATLASWKRLPRFCSATHGR